MAKRTSIEMPVSRDEHCSVSVRKIDNGFVVTKSRHGPNGYESSETYHEKKPTIDLNSIGTVGARKTQATPVKSAPAKPKTQEMKAVSRAASSGKRK